MEKAERAGRSGLRGPPVEQLAKPVWMDKLLVIGEPIDRQRSLRRPLGPAALVSPDTQLSQRRQPCPQRQAILGPIAIEDDLPAVENGLRAQQPLDLRRINGLQPGAREGNRARDMPSSNGASRTPAVVGGEGSNIDESQIRVVESLAKFSQVDDRFGSLLGHLCSGYC